MKKSIRVILILLMIGMIAMQTGCEKNQPAANAAEQAAKNPQITFEMTDGQKFVVELLPEYAPNTVNNFISVAKSGFYEGTIFHRIEPDLILQGGGIAEDPDNPGQYYEKDVGYSIKGEFANNGFAGNTLKHERGIVSTARTTEPDSAGSQFFVLTAESYPAWDGEYAAFGRVISGMETVDAINENFKRNGFDGDIPTIKSASVETFGVEYPDPEKV